MIDSILGHIVQRCQCLALLAGELCYSSSMLVRVLPPPRNERHAQYMEQALAAIRSSLTPRRTLSLLFATDDAGRGLFLRASDALRPLVTAQMHAWYPGLRLEEAAPTALNCPQDFQTHERQLVLTPEIFPAVRYGQAVDQLNRVSADAVGSILELLPHPQQGKLRASMELTLRLARRRRVQRAHIILDTLARPWLRSHATWSRRYAHWAMTHPSARILLHLARRLPGRTLPLANDPLEQSTSREHEREDNLQACAHKLGSPLFEATLVVRVFAPPDQQAEARTCLEYLTGAVAALGSHRFAQLDVQRCGRRPRRWLASPEEIAHLWHPPTAAVAAAGSVRNDLRELEPPRVILSPPTDEPRTQLGEALFRGQQYPCGLSTTQRLRHMLVCGMTGCGKTTLLKTMLRADFVSGVGCMVIDPHGDLVDELVSMVPRRRTNDVILLDPLAACPVTFNPLACRDPAQRPLIADGTTATFAKLAGDSFGWRSAHYLRNGLLALLELPDATLPLLGRFFSDPSYRNQVIARVSNPAVRVMWQEEFAAKTKKQKSEELSAIQNKVAAFTSHVALQRVLGDPKGTLDLRRAMDEGMILLVSLARGRMGEDSSGLLGALLVTALQVAVLQRADVPPEERRPFFVAIDEAPTFTAAGGATRTLLAEGRKFGCGLTLVGQHLRMFDDETQAGILGNCGTIAAMAVGGHDAELLSATMGGGLTPEDLIALPPHHAYVRIHGYPTQPFLMQTVLRRPGPGRQRPDVLRRTSEHRFGRAMAAL